MTRVHPLHKSGSLVYTKGMPWMVTDGQDQRQRFINDLLTDRWTMSELCQRYGISRPTGYLWRARYE